MKAKTNFKPELLDVFIDGWSESNVNSLKIILEEARKAEQGVFEAGSRISTRGFAFISILTPIAIILISLIAKNALNSSIANIYSYLAIVVAAVILYIITKLGQVIFPKYSILPGNEPRKFILTSYFGIDSEYKNCSDTATMLALIQAKQYAIDFNNNQNLIRHGILKHAINCMWLLLISSIVALFFITLAV